MLPKMLLLTMPSITHARLAGVVLASETVTTFAVQNEAVYYDCSDKTNTAEAESIIRSVFDMTFSEVSRRLNAITEANTPPE